MPWQRSSGTLGRNGLRLGRPARQPRPRVAEGPARFCATWGLGRGTSSAPSTPSGTRSPRSCRFAPATRPRSTLPDQTCSSSGSPRHAMSRMRTGTTGYAELLRLPQRELLAAVLDLPDVRPVQVRLLRKILLMEGTHRLAITIRELAADLETVMAFRHWPRLPSSLVPLARGPLLRHLHWLRDRLGATGDLWLLNQILEGRVDLLLDTSRMLEEYPRNRMVRFVRTFCGDWSGIQRAHDGLILLEREESRIGPTRPRALSWPAADPIGGPLRGHHDRGRAAGRGQDRCAIVWRLAPRTSWPANATSTRPRCAVSAGRCRSASILTAWSSTSSGSGATPIPHQRHGPPRGPGWSAMRGIGPLGRAHGTDDLPHRGRQPGAAARRSRCPFSCYRRCSRRRHGWPHPPHRWGATRAGGQHRQRLCPALAGGFRGDRGPDPVPLGRTVATAPDLDCPFKAVDVASTLHHLEVLTDKQKAGIVTSALSEAVQQSHPPQDSQPRQRRDDRRLATALRRVAGCCSTASAVSPTRPAADLFGLRPHRAGVECDGRHRGMEGRAPTLIRVWMGYFGISEYYRPIPELDHWLRRRIRMCGDWSGLLGSPRALSGCKWG